MASRTPLQTLGQILQQARQARGLSLRRAAVRIHHHDGRPISYRYLHDLERGRRHPSFSLLQELAREFELDVVELAILTGQVEAVVHAYLHEWPDCTAALIRLFLTAQAQGFTAWERLTQQIAALDVLPAVSTFPGRPTLRRLVSVRL